MVVSAKRMPGWLAIPFLIAVALMASPPALADELQHYAQQCDQAIGAENTVRGFDCDAGADVPEQGSAPYLTGATCNEPNRLNRECDPGSHFQVLKRTDDAYVVAHCRKKGQAPGEYGDIAVIQYNRKNGATCFYQALGTLPGQVRAPSEGQSAWMWWTPSATADVGCGGCHDNGPIIRSPYLNQVEKDQPSPGKDNTIPGKDDPSFNSDPQPYAFVGRDFASWKAFKVEIVGNECNNCHRLGVNNVISGDGTALDFAERATSATEDSESPAAANKPSHKNPPSAASPIWMPPHPPFPEQVAPDPTHVNYAKAIHDCAMLFHNQPDEELPNTPLCHITRLAGVYLPPPLPPSPENTPLYDYLLQ